MRIKGLTLFLAFLLLINVSCSHTTKIDKLQNEFYQLYCLIGNDVNSTTNNQQNTYKAIKRLHTDKNLKKINRMYRIIEEYKPEITKLKSPKERAMHDMTLSDLEGYYNEILQLRNSAERWDSLSNKEKDDLQISYDTMEMYVTYLDNKKK